MEKELVIYVKRNLQSMVSMIYSVLQNVEITMGTVDRKRINGIIV